jgi:hypothetical protein
MKRLSHDNADVFDGVMFVDVEIAFRLNSQVEKAMFGQQLEHVVEKPDARVDLPLPAPVERPFDANVGFLCRAVQRRLSGR